jgi:hypothetical protein
MDFTLFVDDDSVKVKFVSAAALGKLSKDGHSAGGDYADRTIRVFRGEARRSQRAVLLHELAHYLYARMELKPRTASEEDACDLFTWLPMILSDERNEALREFLGLTLA